MGHAPGRANVAGAPSLYVGTGGRFRESSDRSALPRECPRHQLVAVKAHVSALADVRDAVGARFGQNPRMRHVEKFAGLLGVHKPAVHDLPALREKTLPASRLLRGQPTSRT